MKMADWRKQEGFTQVEVARRLHVAEPTVSSWEQGGKKPGAATMHRIFDLTAGAVTANDFYDLPSPAPAPSAGDAILSPDTGTELAIGNAASGLTAASRTGAHSDRKRAA